ncbi:MAG: hypothetical protein V1735_04520 [Nanoarchaeota archaeon]
MIELIIIIIGVALAMFWPNEEKLYERVILPKTSPPVEVKQEIPLQEKYYEALRVGNYEMAIAHLQQAMQAAQVLNEMRKNTVPMLEENTSPMGEEQRRQRRALETLIQNT